MKARVKKTNQIIEVEEYCYDIYKEKGCGHGPCYKTNDLDFDDVIDWEQRTFEFAKDMFMNNFDKWLKVRKARTFDTFIKDCIDDSITFINIFKNHMHNHEEKK